MHVSQIAGRGEGRLGSSDAAVTRKSLYREQSRQKCSRTETLTENPCPRPEAPSEKPCLSSERLTGKLHSHFEVPSERNLYMKREETHRCRNLQLRHRNKLSRMTLASNPSSRYHSMNLESGNTMSECRRSLRQYLRLLFTEAEKKGKTRNFRMYIGPGSDGSSADKLSLDLKFNPWDTAITFRPEWRSMSKTVFTQYDPSETRYTCQSHV